MISQEPHEKKPLKRIDKAYILSEISSVLNLEKGIFYTIKELLIRPGKSIRTFIHEDRTRLVKPIVFIIVCSLVYAVLQKWLNFEDGYINYVPDEQTVSASMLVWVSQNYGYANIMMILFIALWIKLFFRKQGYNIFELSVLLYYLMGMGMLFFALSGVLDTLLPFKIIDKGFLVGIFYISWGIGQFFQGNKWLGAFKGFISYMFGIITFTLVILSLGSVIDLLVK